MQNLENLRFNYKKYVNNLTNQVWLSNKLQNLKHKMNNTRLESDYNSFFNNQFALSLDIADFCYYQMEADLEMYLSWLVNGDNKRN